MIGSRNIRKRVLATMENRIAQGQKEFDEVCVREDEKVSESIRAIVDASKAFRSAEEDRIVSSIIG